VPTYQYACRECDHTFEQVQSFSDDSLTVCPSCSGRLRKIFNAVGVVFKGSGFYRNDSRVTADPEGSSKNGADSSDDAKQKDGQKSGESEKTGSKTESGAGTGKSSGDKSDAKPGSKPDSKSGSKPKADSPA